MKRINAFYLSSIAFFCDISFNGAIGRLFLLTTPALYSWYTACYAPKGLRLFSAILVLMQALLYSKLTILMYLIVGVLFIMASWFNRLLRKDYWVRSIYAGYCFIIFLLLFRYF